MAPGALEQGDRNVKTATRLRSPAAGTGVSREAGLDVANRPSTVKGTAKSSPDGTQKRPWRCELGQGDWRMLLREGKLKSEIPM